MVRKPLAKLQLLLIASAVLCLLWPKTANAAPALVQTTNNVTNGGTSVAASYSPTAVSNHLLIVICGARDSATIATPTGFSVAINEAGTPSQAIFYKVSAGTETSISCSTGATSTRLGIHIYEYSGMTTSSPLDAVNTTASTGTGTTANSGSVTTTNANDLLIAGLTTNANSTYSSWTNSFVERNDFANGGAAASRSTYGGADRTVSSTGTYSTAATVGSGDWRGQIASFKISAVFTVDIVDSGGATVSSPSVAMSAFASGFSCQTPTGTLGVSGERIRVTNSTAAPAWTLTIAATSGATSTWSAGTPKYDFNDSSGSPAGCSDGGDADAFGGQLTLDPSVGTSAPQSGCSNTGISLGSSSAFVEGSNNSVTLLTASSSAGLNCFWDLTGVTASQKVPSEQVSGSYSLSLTMTLTAN